MTQKTDNLKLDCIGFIGKLFVVVPILFIIIIYIVFGINLIYLSMPQSLPLQYLLVYNIAIVTLSTVLVKEEERIEKDYEVLLLTSPPTITGVDAGQIVNKGKIIRTKNEQNREFHIKGCLALFVANILGLWIIIISLVSGQMYWGYYLVFLILGLGVLSIVGFMVMYKTYETFKTEDEG